MLSFSSLSLASNSAQYLIHHISSPVILFLSSSTRRYLFLFVRLFLVHNMFLDTGVHMGFSSFPASFLFSLQSQLDLHLAFHFSLFLSSCLISAFPLMPLISSSCRRPGYHLWRARLYHKYFDLLPSVYCFFLRPSRTLHSTPLPPPCFFFVVRHTSYHSLVSSLPSSFPSLA